MIARLTGRIGSRTPGRVVLETGGVGYDVQIPLSTFYLLPPGDEPVTLEIHTHVREDAISLFGFLTPVERRLFEHLIGVSGIGPRLACTLLSGLPPETIIATIRAGEAGPLQQIPGIGRKTAERLVLDLRDRLQAEEAPAAAAGVLSGDGAVADAASALINLGYREPQVRETLRAVTGRGGWDGSVGALLREALERLSGRESRAR